MPWHPDPIRVRLARPTDRLEEVRRFYVEALGLQELGGFQGHDGYDGVMVGLPGWETHLELTSHADGSPCPAPTRDNLLVLYLADGPAVEAAAARMRAHGHEPVAPANPYWAGGALTFEDPDGWRVVLAPGTPGGPPPQEA